MAIREESGGEMAGMAQVSSPNSIDLRLGRSTLKLPAELFPRWTLLFQIYDVPRLSIDPSFARQQPPDFR